METDWELYYFIAVVCWHFLMQIVTAYALVYMLKPFIRDKRHVRVVGAVYFVVVAIVNFPLFQISSFIAYSVAIFAGFAVLLVLDRNRYLQKIFLAVTFFTMRWLASYMGRSVDLFFFRLEVYTWHLAAENPTAFYTFIFSEVRKLVLNACFLMGAAFVLRRAYHNKYEEMNVREFLLFIIPFVSGVFGEFFLASVDDLFEEWKVNYFDAPPDFHIWGFFYCATCYITMIAYIVLFQSYRQKQEEAKRNELLAGQMEEMKRHIGEVERLYQDIRSLKHDMGNHVMVLERLYENGGAGTGRPEVNRSGTNRSGTNRSGTGEESVWLQEYLTTLKERFCTVTEEIRSGNPVTDVILMEWQRRAAEAGVTFTCDFKYPLKENINAFDISVILNNALENAVEAAYEAEKHSYVLVKGYPKNCVYMLEVENTYQGELKVDYETGRYLTTKEDSKAHGYGLGNIRRMAEKYRGHVETEADGRVFRLSVMLGEMT